MHTVRTCKFINHKNQTMECKFCRFPKLHRDLLYVDTVKFELKSWNDTYFYIFKLLPGETITSAFCKCL